MSFTNEIVVVPVVLARIAVPFSVAETWNAEPLRPVAITKYVVLARWFVPIDVNN